MIIPLLLATAVSAAAQAPADIDSALAASFHRAGAAMAEAKEARPVFAAKASVESCSYAKELETSFEMAITFTDGRKPAELKFSYESCREEGRNDYLPPYTERRYEGQDGYSLVILSDEGRSRSEVLLSYRGQWVGRFGTIENTQLVSGESVAAGDIELKGAVNGKAVMRNAAVPLYPQLLPCEQALKKEFGVELRDAQGKPYTGYASRAVSLVLLTATDAYYYHEDCDICAEVTKCALQSRAISSVVTAHVVSCSDMAPYAKNAVFDSCAAGR